MTEETKPVAQDFPITPISLVAIAAGWVVPGGGHFLLKKWYRGAILFCCITLMFTLGVMMNGKIFAANTGDILDMLGFVSNLNCGVLYFIARSMEWGNGSPMMASAAYGTAFIMVSGLLNLVSAIDAHHIALGKKP
jgi:hypothetical protein